MLMSGFDMISFVYCTERYHMRFACSNFSFVLGLLLLGAYTQRVVGGRRVHLGPRCQHHKHIQCSRVVFGPRAVSVQPNHLHGHTCWYVLITD